MEINIGKNIVVIDDSDFASVKNLKMYVYSLGGGKQKVKYCVFNLNGKSVFLHRFLMNAKRGDIIDHINGNGLDNRKENLRFCTVSQNMFNRKKAFNSTSRYYGVSFDKHSKKWRSQIHTNGKSITFGRYDNEVDAAKAYDIRVKKYKGEFAKLTF